MAYQFGSPLIEATNQLRAELEKRANPITRGLTVGTKIPTGRNSTDLAPLLVVAQDGPGQVRQRIHQDANLRLLTWHRSADDTDDLIRYASAVFQTTSGGGIRAVLPGTAPWVETDPDTGNPMGVATFAVQMIAGVLPD